MESLEKPNVISYYYHAMFLYPKNISQYRQADVGGGQEDGYSVAMPYCIWPRGTLATYY